MNARWMLATIAAVSVILSALAGATISRATRDRERASALVDRLLSEPASGVAYVLEDLRPQRDLVVNRLRDCLSDTQSSFAARLHAACALADMDAEAAEFLVAAIRTAPAAECRNVVTALEAVKPSLTPAIARKAEEETDPISRARYAIVALHLGDLLPARRMLALTENPLDRTTFIHTFTTWHADASAAATWLSTCDDEAFRSGVCVALGTLEPGEIHEANRTLATLYLEAPDGGTHSATGWALRQLGQPLPEVPRAARASADRSWFVNGQGMTMIRCSPGKFQMGTPGEPPYDDEGPAHEVTLTRGLYFSDREVTVEQFLRFIRDADYPADEKPQPWDERTIASNSAVDCPVQMINWFDAVLYCNWLSGREGRRPCYQRTGKEMLKDYAGRQEQRDLWRCDFSADGYRLPTEAEWEYAARAVSAAAYCFGEGTTRLQDYAWFVNNSDAHLWSGGLKLPNARGLFDMHGNVWEWCWDREGPYPAGPMSDPPGPDVGPTRILRGGASGVGGLGCRSAFRFDHRPTYRGVGYGLRVCCKD